ncbi:hypothetical protein BB561_006344 [Smittium simulii]|uniref:Uncharacterized protein n=1 Tax=Smittium simulii TaxID=133385 RepID=A0A2T9Y505_9FUNG|nr:hypothetical protein BB561_006344 [Smittium simulii]
MGPIQNFNSAAPFDQMSGIQLSLLEYSGKGDELSFKRWFNNCVDKLKAFGFTYDALKYDNPNMRIFTLAILKETLENRFVDISYDIKLRFRLLNLKQTVDIAKYIEEKKMFLEIIETWRTKTEYSIQ